jgi:hypothetical protein
MTGVPRELVERAFEYAAPMNGGQYNDVLANDTYLVAVMKELST